MERALILAHENGVKSWCNGAPVLQANGVSDFVVSVYIAFANIKLFFLIRDEAKHEFQIIIADWSGFSSLV